MPSKKQKPSEQLEEDIMMRLYEKLSAGLMHEFIGIDSRLKSIESLLAGEPGKEKIGIMERLRRVEAWAETQNRLLWIIIPLILSNIVSIIGWIRMSK